LHASGIKLLSRGGGVFVTAQKGRVIQRATAKVDLYEEKMEEELLDKREGDGLSYHPAAT